MKNVSYIFQIGCYHATFKCLRAKENESFCFAVYIKGRVYYMNNDFG